MCRISAKRCTLPNKVFLSNGSELHVPSNVGSYINTNPNIPLSVSVHSRHSLHFLNRSFSLQVTNALTKTTARHNPAVTAVAAQPTTPPTPATPATALQASPVPVALKTSSNAPAALVPVTTDGASILTARTLVCVSLGIRGEIVMRSMCPVNRVRVFMMEGARRLISSDTSVIVHLVSNCLFSYNVSQII